jgi:hypothetical protein
MPETNERYTCNQLCYHPAKHEDQTVQDKLLPLSKFNMIWKMYKHRALNCLNFSSKSINQCNNRAEALFDLIFKKIEFLVTVYP